MGNNFILELYKRPQTVFLLGDIVQLFPTVSYKSLKEQMRYYVKTGKLRRLRSGVYAKMDYDLFELANRVYTPSYISLETVLQKESVVFQVYQTMFVVSYLSREIDVQRQKIVYRKIKDEILVNPDGIEQKETYAIATKERAFLDAVYLYKDYHFDNVGILNWDMVDRIKEIYDSKELVKRVEEYKS